MFPNFCFSKTDSDHYNIVRRTYLPKEACKSGQVRIPSRAELNSLLLHTALKGTDGLDLLRDKSILKRMKRARKLAKVNTPRRQAPDHIAKQQEALRAANFQLPAVVSKPAEPAPPTAPQKRENAGQAQPPTVQQVPPSQAQSSAEANRQLQESCADFFNIVHDNVLEAVQVAVERMVCKYFQDTMNKVEQLSNQLTQNETLLGKIYQDLTGKIAEQNETSINQFKFIAQMLIDSQTVHYRALHQHHQRHKRAKSVDSNSGEEHEQRESREHRQQHDHRETRESRSTAGDGQAMVSSGSKQHQLRQQQQPQLYGSQCCQRCTTQGSSMATASATATTARRLPSKPTTIRRLPKNAGTASMPNLQRGLSSSAAPAAAANKARQRAPTPHSPSLHSHHTHSHSQGNSTRQTSTHRLYTRPSTQQQPPQHSHGRSFSHSHHSHPQQLKPQQELARSCTAVQRKQRCRHVRTGPSAENVTVKSSTFL